MGGARTNETAETHHSLPCPIHGHNGALEQGPLFSCSPRQGPQPVLRHGLSCVPVSYAISMYCLEGFSSQSPLRGALRLARYRILRIINLPVEPLLVWELVPSARFPSPCSGYPCQRALPCSSCSSVFALYAGPRLGKQRLIIMVDASK